MEKEKIEKLVSALEWVLCCTTNEFIMRWMEDEGILELIREYREKELETCHS